MTPTSVVPEIRTKEDFAKFVQEVEGREGYVRPAMFALGLATYSSPQIPYTGEVQEDARILEVWFPHVNVEGSYGTAAVLRDVVGHLNGSGTFQLTAAQLTDAFNRFSPYHNELGHLNVEVLRDFMRWAANREANGDDDYDLPQRVVAVFIDDLSIEPADAADVYLRLHAWSYRLVDANGMAFTPSKVMPLLANVAWTSVGPVLAEQLPELIRYARIEVGVPVRVYCVDKIPHILDFVYPSGVRIANGAQVRLGANLGEGVTVMQVGFANFNTQADGPNMIEGRLSSKVRIGKGTDLGGGSSTMGTMSGGNNVVVSIGENSLIGANGGIGIPLGDNCKVEAGLYIKPGREVFVVASEAWVNPMELAGENNLTFRWNTQLERIEVVPTKGTFALNTELHTNTNTPVGA